MRYRFSRTLAQTLGSSIYPHDLKQLKNFHKFAPNPVKIHLPGCLELLKCTNRSFLTAQGLIA